MENENDDRISIHMDLVIEILSRMPVKKKFLLWAGNQHVICNGHGPMPIFDGPNNEITNFIFNKPQQFRQHEPLFRLSARFRFQF